MRKLNNTVILLESARRAHSYLIGGEHPTLIDTGMPGGVSGMLREISAADTEPCRLERIFLTHHDVDHIGNAAALQKATGAKVYAPVSDIPFILGQKKRPKAKQMIAALLNVDVPRIDVGVEDGQLFGEVRAIVAPGHTPGHTIYQYRDVLFIGDLFRIPEGIPERMPAKFIWNASLGDESIAMIKTLSYEWICPAHGDPLRAEDENLKRFLTQF
ncbi:MAG: MBL fold metallo-hydrolase [Anaerofustis sp.]